MVDGADLLTVTNCYRLVPHLSVGSDAPTYVKVKKKRNSGIESLNGTQEIKRYMG